MNKKDDILSQEASEILALKAKIKAQRKRKVFSQSKLRKHFAEAKRLREEFGFTFADITLWLRQKKRVKMTVNGVKSAYNRINKEYENNKSITL